MSRAVSAAVAAGKARKLAPRLYTSNMTDAPAAIIRRNLWRAVSLLAPGTVVSHRTAIEMTPAEDNTVFVTAAYNRRLELPGLRLRFVEGPGALDGDTPLFDLHLASLARALLEVLKPSRARSSVARGLPRARVEQMLEAELAAGGDARLNALRDQARSLLTPLDAGDAFAQLDALIGALLGTRRTPLSAPAAIARAAGEPYDADRLQRFQILLTALRAHSVVPRPDARLSDPEFSNLAFFDAYFSNFIEGTRFDVAEARAIVFEGRIPAARPQDAHDVLGTYRVVGSRAWMERSVTTFADFDAFLRALRTAHLEMLGARADKRPGQFKLLPNVAGHTAFVSPALVRGTLRQGFDIVRSLAEPFQRAVAIMFVLAEVHPFDDGNGRLARAFMNAELIGGRQRRILIPSVYREDYLTALRVLTRQDHAVPLIAMLDFAHRYTAAIDFSTFDGALATLQGTDALEDPGPNVRLHLTR
ncbi:MAG TPA: Fic family protein [Gemmatimonadaceae bacterium]